jgi:hypothetical protein
MQQRNAALLALLCLLIILSCKRDNSDVKPLETAPAGRYVLMAPLRSAPQTFTVTAGVYSTIVGAKRTVIYFNPTSFRAADGSTLTSGIVNITLEEMYRPGEMIANCASTNFNGSPLVSGGQIHIVATQNGQTLEANYYDLRFPQPAPSTQPMNLYIGGRNNDSVVVWSDFFRYPIAARTAFDSINNVCYLFDSVTSFNWLNCDHFYSDPSPKTDLTVALPDTTFNPSNTFVWIVFPSINSVSCLGLYSVPNSSFGFESMPIGIKFHIIEITNKNGNWYYAEQLNQTAVKDHKLSLLPQAKTLDEIKAALGKL